MTPLLNPDKSIQTRFTEYIADSKDFVYYDNNPSYMLVAEKKTHTGKVYQRSYITLIANNQDFIDRYMADKVDFRCQMCEDRGLYWKPETEHTVYCLCELGINGRRYDGQSSLSIKMQSVTNANEIDVTKMFQ